MKIGKSCFIDKNIQSQIESHNKKDTCDLFDRFECVYDTKEDDYLNEIFIALLDSFRIKNDDFTCKLYESKMLIDYLSEWNIFSEGINILDIIKEVCPSYYKDSKRLFENKVCINGLLTNEDFYKKSILNNGDWNDFCDDIKHRNRFHTKRLNLDQFELLLTTSLGEGNVTNLKLKRARICDEQHYENGFGMDELGAPPEKVASAGRANSEGISCLYLANDTKTTLYETRARDNDHISVGTFEQKEELKLIDFTILDSISPLSSEEMEISWYVANIGFVRQIAKEIAKPLRRFDKALDYLPIQYICDYIKSCGFDGIKYRSTLDNEGINYAIFYPNKFECTNVENLVVNKIEYEWENIEIANIKNN